MGYGLWVRVRVRVRGSRNRNPDLSLKIANLTDYMRNEMELIQHLQNMGLYPPTRNPKPENWNPKTGT
jgi:hypothetical protein